MTAGLGGAIYSSKVSCEQLKHIHAPLHCAMHVIGKCVQAQQCSNFVVFHSSRELRLTDVKVDVLSAEGSPVLTNSGTYPTELLKSPQLPAQHSIQVCRCLDPSFLQKLKLAVRVESLDSHRTWCYMIRLVRHFRCSSGSSPLSWATHHTSIIVHSSCTLLILS
jgi:hypothetical protein